MSEELTYANVIERFLEAVPEFREMPNNNLEDFGPGADYAPHNVFGAATYFIVNEYRAKRTGRHSAFRRALDFMEKAMVAPDIEVQNLVWCSFLEDLHVAEEDYEAIKSHLGPELAKTLAQIEKQYRETHWKRP